MYSFEGKRMRLVIPKELCHQILINFHSANQGSTSMIACARQTVYWPGMDRDINNHVQSCLRCRENAPSYPKESMIVIDPPEYPFQKVVADLFEIEGRIYLAYVDQLTGYAELAHFPYSVASATIINTFNTFIFHRSAMLRQNTVIHKIKKKEFFYRICVRATQLNFLHSFF